MMVGEELVLIETGARMHGGKGPTTAKLNKNQTQVNMTLDVQMDGGIFEQLQDGSLKNPLLKTAIEVDLVSPVSGYLLKSLELEEIKLLPSF